MNLRRGTSTGLQLLNAWLKLLAFFLKQHQGMSPLSTHVVGLKLSEALYS